MDYTLPSPLALYLGLKRTHRPISLRFSIFPLTNTSAPICFAFWSLSSTISVAILKNKEKMNNSWVFYCWSYFLDCLPQRQKVFQNGKRFIVNRYGLFKGCGQRANTVEWVVSCTSCGVISDPWMEEKS